MTLNSLISSAKTNFKLKCRPYKVGIFYLSPEYNYSGDFMKENKIFTLIINLIIVLVITCVGAISFMDISPDSEVVSAPFYSGNKEGNCVSIMFNVYGGEEYLPEIVDTLKQYDAKATFFIGGVWAIKHEDSLKMLADSGNEIANHGYLHRDHKSMSFLQNIEEIKTAERTIEGICGVKTTLFAPPSGAFSENTVKACEKLGYSVIMWSKDTIDWRDHDATLIYKRATENVKSGDLILMHPTLNTLEALSPILKKYKELNFRINIVSENIMLS